MRSQRDPPVQCPPETVQLSRRRWLRSRCWASLPGRVCVELPVWAAQPRPLYAPPPLRPAPSPRRPAPVRLPFVTPFLGRVPVRFVPRVGEIAWRLPYCTEGDPQGAPVRLRAARFPGFHGRVVFRRVDAPHFCLLRGEGRVRRSRVITLCVIIIYPHSGVHLLI